MPAPTSTWRSSFGSPAYTEGELEGAAEQAREAADLLLARALPISVRPGFRPVQGAPVAVVEGELRQAPWRLRADRPGTGPGSRVVVDMPSSGLSYSLAGAERPALRLRRFADGFAVVPDLPPGPARVTIPMDRSDRPWEAETGHHLQAGALPVDRARGRLAQERCRCRRRASASRAEMSSSPSSGIGARASRRARLASRAAARGHPASSAGRQPARRRSPPRPRSPGQAATAACQSRRPAAGSRGSSRSSRTCGRCWRRASPSRRVGPSRSAQGGSRSRPVASAAPGPGPRSRGRSARRSRRPARRRCADTGLLRRSGPGDRRLRRAPRPARR